MDALIDQGSAAFDGPAPFFGARVVVGGAVPFHVRVGLEKFSEPIERAFQKLRGFVKSMLAHDAENDSCLLRRADHARRYVERRGDRLLQLDMLFFIRAS